MVTLIRIGFSGTREGMTRVQMLGVYQHIAHSYLIGQDNNLVEAHHGDCLGADVQFHVIATILGGRTVAHPPLNPRFRAWCKADEIREPLDYLARDWNIAYETAELLAAPKSDEPYPGSGTWRTVSYAVGLGRPVTVYLPEGQARPGASFFGFAPLPGRARS